MSNFIGRFRDQTPATSPQNRARFWQALGRQSPVGDAMQRYSDVRFAVVDVETTGMWAEGTDRIVEVAVVHLASDLSTDDEYSTLVHPQRDLGPTWLHGITGQHIESAPTFAAVADDLIVWLRGRILVAFNGRFDVRFLDAEFLRLGVALPHLPLLDLRDICSGTLSAACEAHGILVEDAHSALGDARVTAELLRRLAANGEIDAYQLTEPAPADAWPILEYEPTAYQRPVLSDPPIATALPPLQPGSALCFTGDSFLMLGGIRLNRLLAEQLAENAGFIVKSGVSRKLTALVAADPHSTSGKAMKARNLGVPIVDEATFWQTLGYQVSR